MDPYTAIFGAFVPMIILFDRFVFFQAVIGLIMSIIMKHGSNILRLFVISCAMVVNTILSKLVFSLQPGVDFWLAFVLVLLALYLYYNQKS